MLYQWKKKQKKPHKIMYYSTCFLMALVGVHIGTTEYSHLKQMWSHY